MRGSIAIVASIVATALLIEAPAAQADDRRICSNNYDDVQASIAACTRLLRSRRATPAQRAIRLNNRGAGYVLLKRYDLAIADLDLAIRIDPNYRSAYVNRGIAHYRLEAHNRALVDLTTAIVLDPNFATPYDYRGRVLHALGRHDKAIKDYTAALRLAPDDAGLYRRRGEAFHAMQDHTTAIADFDAAIRLAPGDATTYRLRGQAYHDSGRLAEAIGDYTRAIHLDGSDAEAHHLRAMAWAAREDAAAALADFTQAIRRNPEADNSYSGRSRIHLKLGRASEALADAERAIAINAEHPEAHATRGEALAMLGRRDEAIASLRRGLELDPDNTAARAALERLGAGSDDIARTAARRPPADGGAAAPGPPLDADATDDDDGWRLCRTGKPAERVSACGEIIAAASTPRERRDAAYALRGRAYLGLEQPQRALADFDTLIESGAQDAAPHHGRGIAYFQMKRYRDAIASFGEALERDPDNPSYWHDRAMLLFLTGAYAAARADVERSLALRPRDQDTLRLRQAIERQFRGKRSQAPAGPGPDGRPRDGGPSPASAGTGEPAGSAGAVAPEAVSALQGAYNGVGSALLELFEADDDSGAGNGAGNVALSPYSIGSAMAMTLHGASGETEAEMRRILRHTLTRPQIAAANRTVLAMLRQRGASPPGERSRRAAATPNQGEAGPAFRADVANALMLGPGGGLIASDYIADLVSDYGARMFQGARLEDVNAWVREQTHGQIDRILDRLAPNYSLVILNAVTMTARWAEPFDPGETGPGPFTTASGRTIDVPTMRREGLYAIAAVRGQRAISLPYADPALAMIIVLPDGPARGEDRPPTADTLAALAGALRRAAPIPIDLTLPRFKLAFDADLVQAFRRLGLARPFAAQTAEFGAMAGPSAGPGLFIDQIRHRVVVDVAEAGTRASAATAVAMAPGAGRRDPAPVRPFHVDRPFRFFITDHRSGALLFLGRVADPSG